MDTGKLHAGSIRVLLVDDEVDIRDIVKTLLSRAEDIDLVGMGVNGQEAVSLCAELCPDVLLLDILMPVMDGFEAASLVRERFPAIKILVLSSIRDHESVEAMLKNKVSGYVDKSALAKNLALDIRAAYGGSMVFSPDVFAAHLDGDAGENETCDFGLSPREKEVLKLMKAGLNMPEIAAELTIGKTTVKTHIENIVRKFRVETRAEALVVAAKNNLP